MTDSNFNIDFGTQPPAGGGPNIDFQDWETPSAPKGVFGGGNWADNFSFGAPQADAQSKPFPDYAVVDPNDIGNAFNSLAKSFDVGMGVAKQVIPGLGGIGDALGAFGHGIDQVPVIGGAKEGLGNLVGMGGDLLTKPISAIAGRVGEMAGEVGRTFDPNNPDPWKFLDAPFRVAGAAALGETGVRAFDFGRPIDQSVWDNLPKDVGDSLAIASLVPALKGIGLLGKATADVGATQFLRGFTRPLEGFTLEKKATQAIFETQFANTAERAGQLAGRFVLGTSGIGLGAEFALPKVAADQGWARDIMNNRVVAEDSPWRFPFEMATSLPLDLVSLTKMAAESRLTQWASIKSYGPAPLGVQIRFGNDTLTNAINTGLTDEKRIGLLEDYSRRKVAEDHIVRAWNEWHPGAEAKTVKDLPHTQVEMAALVKNAVTRLTDLYGPKKMGELASDKMDFWFNQAKADGITGEAQLQWWNEYADQAVDIESRFHNVTVAIADDTIHGPAQTLEAYDYLHNALQEGHLGYNEIAGEMKLRFPGLSDLISNNPDVVKLEKELLGTVGGATQEQHLASLRAQLRESEVRTSKLMSGFDETASKPEFKPQGPDVPTQAQASDLGAEQAKAVNAMTDTVLGKYSEKLQAEIKNMEDLQHQITLTERPTIGSLEATLDGLVKRIAGGNVSLAEQAQQVYGKIKSIRDEAASDIEKQASVVWNAMQERTDAVMASGSTADRAMLDMERQAAINQIHRLNELYFQAKTAGSRWQIIKDSRQPMMRVADETGAEYTRAERTAAGKIHDKLFGGIPNAKLAMESHQRFDSTLSEWGNSDAKIKAYKKLVGEWMDTTDHEFRSGMRMSAFGSIFHVPGFILGKLAKQAKLTIPEGKSVGEAAYRAYPGPLKIFQDEVFGKELVKAPYIAPLVLATRSIYPMFRFYLSPRFLAMNFFEPQMIGGGLGGTKFAAAKGDSVYFDKLAHDLSTATSFDVYDKAGVRMSRNIIKAMYVKRPDEVVRSILDTVRVQPEMADIVKEWGTKDQWYEKFNTMMNERLDIAKSKTALNAKQEALKGQIEDLSKNLKAGIGDELMNRSELARLEASLQKDVIDVKTELAAKEAGINVRDAKYQPFLDAIKYNEDKLIESIRQSFVGNPERSAVERGLNSFLLYWPLSYQLKATKLLTEFLTSRAFGFQTGSLGAVTYAHMRQEHEMKMQTDPEYANFFNSNKNLLFLLRQMLPITPEDIGVSLSPIIRVPRDIAMGKTAVGAGVARLATVGPTYDTSLFQRIMTEQVKPGGIFHDIFGKESN